MAAPVKNRGITFAYGIRRARYAAGFHTGDDYAAPFDYDVRATRAGKVVIAGWYGSYGYTVAIQTGGVRHFYCHLSRVRVRVGQNVSAGQLIGNVGSTGMSLGNHCHYEERTFPYGYNNKVRRPSFNRTAPPKTGKKSTVSLKTVNSARRSGKKHSQVLILQKALAKEVGLNYSSGPGIFGPRTRAAYAKWQRKLGFRGKDADGIPGLTSLQRLGKKRGFNGKS